MRRIIPSQDWATVPPRELQGVTPPPSGPDPSILRDAILATGGTWADALAGVADALGREAVQRILEAQLGILAAKVVPRPMGYDWVEPLFSVDSAVTLLNQAALAVDGTLAQGGLDGWLARLGGTLPCTLDLRYAKWLTHLPDNLVVEGDLRLSWSAIQGLPYGLRVIGNLAVDGCFRLVSLPPDCVVHGILTLNPGSGIFALDDEAILYGSPGIQALQR